MTKKDYIVLADAFVEAWEKVCDNPNMTAREAFIITRGEIMGAIDHHNENFDPTKFIAYIAKRQEEYYA